MYLVELLTKVVDSALLWTGRGSLIFLTMLKFGIIDEKGNDLSKVWRCAPPDNEHDSLIFRRHGRGGA